MSHVLSSIWEGRLAGAPVMVNQSQTMRFSREVIEGVEWFTVTWLDANPSEPRRTAHYPTAPRFKAWLIDDQGYLEHEAEQTIEQLCTR